jgi:hypothetical protein
LGLVSTKSTLIYFSWPAARGIGDGIKVGPLPSPAEYGETVREGKHAVDAEEAGRQLLSRRSWPKREREKESISKQCRPCIGEAGCLF